MRIILLAASAAYLSTSVAQAQTAPAQVAPAAPVAAPAALAAGSVDNVLRTGTTVPLRMLEALTTEGKKLKVGHRFNLEVAEAVSVNGHIVIPAGSTAVGEVTDVRNKGMWGKSGRINARLLYLRANGRQIRLSGQLDDKGVTGTAGVVGAVALVPVAGFFMTGTSARIPVATPVTAFIDEDVAFTPGAAAQPMVVAPAAPAPVPAVVPVAVPATTPRT